MLIFDNLVHLEDETKDGTKDGVFARARNNWRWMRSSVMGMRNSIIGRINSMV